MFIAAMSVSMAVAIMVTYILVCAAVICLARKILP